MRAWWLVLLAGCDVSSADRGYGALLQVDGAQFEPGGPPAPAGGPAVVDAFLFTSVVTAGDTGLRLQGVLDPGTNGAVIALDDDDGYWIAPSGIPDVFDPTRPTLDVDVSFARVLAAGAHAMTIQAVDADGRAGEPLTLDLDVVAPAIPDGTLVLTLRWDSPTDLDLHVVTPDGIEVWSRNINSYEPPAPGQPPDPPDAWMAGGILDVDSNARCVIDGRAQENVVWTMPAPAGQYLVRVDAFSLCGQAAARWVTEARIDGDVVDSASGLATFEDTQGAHDTGAGVLALEIEVPVVRLVLVVAAILLIAGTARADDGEVRIDGLLLDADTYEPVAGAIVQVLGESATSGDEGEFVLEHLAPGQLQVRVSAPGRAQGSLWQTFAAGTTTVVYSVHANGSLEAGEAIVVAGEFHKEPPPPPPAAVHQTVDVAEASHVAGSGGDAGKVVQNMAGVSRPAAGSGALVVWGAAPKDTAILVDGVELPQLYHLGGVRSVLATDMVGRIDLQPGAFGADVGRVLGGVVRVQTAALPEELTARVSADVLDGAIGFGGPLARKLRAAAAVRASWIDRLASNLDDRSAELFSLPRYQDAHLRFRYVVGEGEHVDFVAIGSHDKLVRALGADEPATARTRTIETGLARLWVRWQREDGDVTAAVTPWLGVDVDDGSELQAGAGSSHETTTWRAGLRAEYRTRLGAHARLGLGADLAFGATSLARTGTLTVPAREGDPYVFGRPPGVDLAHDTWRVATTELAPNATVEVDVGPVTLAPGLRVAALVVDVDRVLPPSPTAPKLGGARFDWLVEPRLAAMWKGTGSWKLAGAIGRHHRAPAPEDLSAVFGNPTLGPEAAWCVTASATYGTGANTLEIAGFVRELEDLVVRTEAPVPVVAELLTQDGAGAVRGAQLTLRRTSARGLSGWIAYTLSESVRQDHPDRNWRPFDYDQRHVLTAVASYTWRRWAISARERVATGAPRTPVVGASYESRLDRWEPFFGVTNSVRIPTFRQFDLRLEHTFDLGPVAATAYLEILNMTDHENAEELVYSYDYATQGTLNGMPLLGVLGLEGRL